MLPSTGAIESLVPIGIDDRQWEESLPDRSLNSRIGPYQLIREIGRGGMATVYEARDENQERVALKVLDVRQSKSDKRVGRFMREGEATSRLKHPNIIRIFQVGQDGDFCFIAMELIDGPTLEDLIFELRRGRKDALRHFRPDLASLPDPVVTSTGYQRAILEALANIASAVQVAHDVDLVHRDIKPSNILMDKNGRLVLTDFGLVQDMAAETLTLTGDVLGTPLYMSPEQIAGDRNKIGPHSDIYALGATIHEALGLNAAYSATEIAALAKQIARHEPRNLAELNPTLPKSVHTIIRRAMAKRPHDRYGSAAALAADIHTFLAGGQIKAKPPSVAEKLRATMRRNPKAVAVTFAITGLLVAILGTVGFLMNRDDNKRAREARRSFDDGQALLQQEAWSAAWRAAQEVEVELKNEDLAHRLREDISGNLEQEFKENVGMGVDGLRKANQLRQSVMQLSGISIDTSLWQRSLSLALMTIATSDTSATDEPALDRIWQSSSASLSEKDRALWANRLEQSCAVEQANRHYLGAYTLARRADRWHLRTSTFPPKDYEKWVRPEYKALSTLAQKTSQMPWASAFREMTLGSFSSFPWPEIRTFLQELAAKANAKNGEALLGLLSRSPLLGMTDSLIAMGERVPDLRVSLLTHWAWHPQSEAQEALLSWAPEFLSLEHRLQLAKALEEPSPRARVFLEAQLPTAEAPLLKILSQSLGMAKNQKEMTKLKLRLAKLQTQERQLYLTSFVALGGQAEWAWIASWLTDHRQGGEEMRRALRGNMNLVPKDWCLKNLKHRRSSLRHIAQDVLIASSDAGREIRQELFLDEGEELGVRIRCGLLLAPEEQDALLGKLDLLEIADPVILAFALSLSLPGPNDEPEDQSRRAANLLRAYRESKEDLVRAWALRSLEAGAAPDLAPLIARDLNRYQVDSTGNILLGLLGKSPMHLALSQVLSEMERQSSNPLLPRSRDLNAARCRFLGQMASKTLGDGEDMRTIVARALVKCATRNDMSTSARKWALSILPKFKNLIEIDELASSLAPHAKDEIVGVFATLLSVCKGHEAALRFLEERPRLDKFALVAQSLIFAGVGRYSRAMRSLELAYMAGFRLQFDSPDFSAIEKLRQQKGFHQLWRALQSK